MRRRTFLVGALPLGTASLAGCLFGIGGRLGVNPNLELRNQSPESVELAIVVSLNEPAGSQNSEIVYEDIVSLSAGETRVIEVLGDNQYEITVSLGEQSISFGTRPICDAAHTIVLVDESGTLRSDVEFCE